MFTPTTPLLSRSNSIKYKFLTCFAIFLLSVYPIYRNIYYGNAVRQYERHLDFLHVTSDFHNPWQYRIFAPLTVEGIKKVYDITIDRLYQIEENFRFTKPDGFAPKDRIHEIISMLDRPGFVRYNLIYSSYRFFLNVTIYVLSFYFFGFFARSHLLRWLGLILIAYAMGNAVNDSDYTLHSYIDVILYLITAIIILGKHNPKWLLLVTFIGATNRETSALIPVLYFVSSIDWNQWRSVNFKLTQLKFPPLQKWVVTSLCLVIFIMVFVAIREYYGYKPPTEFKVASGLPMLKLNLISISSIKSYFELIGLFSIIPLMILYWFKKVNFTLKLWFIAIVPFWFLIHFSLVVAYQGRLFLVPTILVFIPIFLTFIDKDFKEDLITQSI